MTSLLLRVLETSSGVFVEGVVDIVAASGFGFLLGRFIVDGGIVQEDGTLAPFSHEGFVVAF